MKWRIWLVSLCVTLVSVVLFGIYATQVYYNSSVDDGKNYLKVYMNEFDATEFSFDEAGAKAYSDKLNGARVTFMDAQGSVIADSATETPDPDHSTRPEIIEAISNGKNGEGFAVRSSSTLGQNMIYYCKNFNGEFLVRVAIFTDTGWLIFVKTLPTLISFLAIMIGLCVVVAVVTTNIIVAPMKKLASDAVDNDSVTTSYPELEPIADMLNERSRNIKVQMTEIKAEKELVEKATVSKDEFISNVTHEMNTPLTSIHGYAELLDAGGMTDEQKATAYKTILAQSERLTNLIACIINYSEIDSDDLPAYDVDFSALARETLCALKPEADKRNVSIVENIDDGVIIPSRHERLSELFGNLVRNAIKYNKDGGKVIVTLNRNNLIVEDTGIGIADENKDKVFSRFFTVDKSHSGKNGGFGLGLAVVKKICRKSGWKLSLDSTLGEGSKFTVTF
ncbi:MAG: ATP-binding protein [Christensenellales bacterium]